MSNSALLDRLTTPGMPAIWRRRTRGKAEVSSIRARGRREGRKRPVPSSSSTRSSAYRNENSGLVSFSLPTEEVNERGENGELTSW